jgi:predicted DNA-binding protein (MmcQ/YjbR family)
MYALTGLEGDPPYVNLKCDPGRAIELRSQYEDIKPGWHMNKIIII